MLPFVLIAGAALLWSRRASVSAPVGSVLASASLKSQLSAVLLKPRFVPAPASPPLSRIKGTGTGVLGVPFCQTRAAALAQCRAEEKLCRDFHKQIAPIVKLGPTCAQQGAALLSCYLNPGGTNINPVDDNFR